jgi:RNA polymerase sigma-70 factor (ECF subfamily)
MFRADTRLDAWLAIVIHNLAMDLFRRPWHKRSARLDVMELPMSVPEAPRWWEDISDQDVRRALVRCSSVVREAFELRHYGGLSLAGIASRTGAPIRTVATRIFRARAQVRRVLESERRGGPGRQAAAPAARRAAG